MYLLALGPQLFKSCCQETDCFRIYTHDLSVFLLIREERPFIISILQGLGNCIWSLYCV